MKLNDIPKLMPVPFGVSGPRTELLESSPAGDRKASYKDGFPPITMLLKSAGGLPPDGGNMNQILFELASGQRWSNAGAGYNFNKTFSDAVGGYPKGAQLLSNDGAKIYVSTKDDNKTDFNASPGVDWMEFGDYIGLDSKLDKSKVTNSLINSRGLVPTTALLIDNLALKQPIGDYQQAGYSYSKAESDNKYQPKGDYATNAALNKIIPPKGMVSFFLHRENALPAGWYSLNGDRYSADSFAGKALRSLPGEIKSDWGIIDSGTTITTPNLRQSDGRLPFIRPSNSKGTAPGVVSGDTMRNINGEFGYESQYGLATSDSDVTGAFYRFGPSRKSFMGGGTGQTTNIAFSADRVVPTGPEFKPLSIDMVVAVYLGVA